MAGKTPEQALDAYVDRIRAALSCVTDAIAFGSGIRPGQLHALSLYAVGQSQPNRIRLRTHGGQGELVLQVAMRYSVVFQPDVVQRAPYDVWTSYYQYRVMDREEREIVVYHWEPESRSPVLTPHLHVPAAEPVVLPQQVGSAVSNTKTYLSKLHLPSGRIILEDILLLLLTDMAVDPLRDDWRDVLGSNR